jgi:hypothetical protein
MTQKSAVETTAALSSERATTSGWFRMNACCQNMKHQCPVKEIAQSKEAMNVVRRMSAPKRPPIVGAACRSFSADHSSVSGTSLRIQRVTNAGRTPMRNTQRGW